MFRTMSNTCARYGEFPRNVLYLVSESTITRGHVHVVVRHKKPDIEMAKALKQFKRLNISSDVRNVL